MNAFFRPFPFLVTATLASALLVSPTRVHAFGGPPGGPFGNGSYFPDDGTFSAVVRGENLTGTLQFSTTQGSGPTPSSVEQQTTSTGSITTQATITSSALGGVGSTGVAFIYYNGDTYIGNSQGSLNPADSSLVVNFQAGAPGQGEGKVDVKTPVVTLVNLPIQGPDGNITGYVTSNETTFQVTRQISYLDSLYLNGVAECETSNAFPNQKFKGKGKAEFQHLVFTGNTPFLDAVPIPISISGVRLSREATSFAIRSVRPPSVSEVSVLVQ